MRRGSMNITILGYGLAAVYGFGLLVYLIAYSISLFDPHLVLDSFIFKNKFAGITEFRRHTVILWALFLPQFIGFLAVGRLQEWGRKLVIVMNVVMLLCVTYQMMFVLRAFHLEYFATQLIYAAVVLFFSLPRVKAGFLNPARMRGQTVLVVDDDKTLLQMLRQCLLTAGFDVLVTQTGEKGLQIARKKKPDIIILDVILPGMKGRQVCIKLKDEAPTRDIPVIFLTAKDSPDDVRAEMEVGGVAHFTKPVECAKLVAEIENILCGSSGE